MTKWIKKALYNKKTDKWEEYLVQDHGGYHYGFGGAHISMSQQDPNAPQPPQGGSWSFGGSGQTTAPAPGPAVYHNPGKGITVVNGTGDPRIVWEDGVVAIIQARDFPANTGMGRGPTRKTPVEALQTQIDPTRVTMPGAGAMNDFVKVVLKDLLARPVGAAPAQAPAPAKGFGFRPPPKPMVASGYGSVAKGVVIPDAHFPHICGVCGGWYYQGTGEHSTPDGRCPSKSAKKK